MVLAPLSAAFSHFPHYPQANWALPALIPGCVSPTNSPMRLGVSPAAASTLKGFSVSGLRLHFPSLEPWGCGVCFTPPLFFLVYQHRNVGQPSLQAAAWRDLPPAPCLSSSTITGSAATLPTVCSSRLPVSALPTGLDECVYFYSLVVRLPCSLIFCQFWLFFIFKLLLSFFWLCEEAQCVYLCHHLGWKSGIFSLIVVNYT